jgi:hypothetical protein
MNDLDVPKGSQPPSRRRFYIGSAAIFWFVLALLIWGILFFNLYLRLQFSDDMWWGTWFFPSYFSAPAVLAALLAVLIRNLSANAVAAWLITPPVFVLIGYLMLRHLFGGFFEPRFRFFMGR